MDDVLVTSHFSLATAFGIFSLIDFLGVTTGAVGGALAARRDERHHYDIVGVVGLALASAPGGGILRDVLIQRGAPWHSPTFATSIARS